MSEENPGREYLETAQALIAAVETGDQSTIDSIIDELTRIRETALFREIGTLTRELHESIKAFQADSRLSAIAASEIPDAQVRLRHVIDMTEQAAHRTLNAIDASMPIVDSVTEQAERLADKWNRFRARELSLDEFRVLSGELDSFFASLPRDGAQVQGHLTEALMAQDYQDLTGQIIRRVIDLVEEVESNLVDLVRLSSIRIAEEKREAADNKDNAIVRGEGPAVPGTTGDGDVVQGQDDVDDLLSSLGF